MTAVAVSKKERGGIRIRLTLKRKERASPASSFRADEKKEGKKESKKKKKEKVGTCPGVIAANEEESSEYILLGTFVLLEAVSFVEIC